MKKFLALLLVVAFLAAGVQVAHATTNVIAPPYLQDLATVRQATAKYHDVNVAIANGYIPTEHCIASPTSGMGYHYVNPTLARDPKIDLATPEILLYALVGGELKLVAVEFFYGVGAPDTSVPNPAPPSPVLFGRTFDGPMLGHEPGMPPHYDLHAWIWQANPDGVFAQFNPNVSCQ